MRAGLIDTDSHNFPNLVLMKLSTWLKSKGYEVELLHPDDILKGNNLFYDYDELYGACVFDWNQHIADRLSELGVYMGGTGTRNKDTLPDEIEHLMPDYSLYGITEICYGFLTRGCPRHCPFCIVGDKEGLISHKVADLKEFWDGQKEIQLLDPNILACKDHMELLEQLAESKAKVEFNQGLDARMLNEDNIALLKRIRIKRIHFAWDNPKDKLAPKSLKMYAEMTGMKPGDRKVMVYVLTNYWSTHEEDLMRIYWLRDLGYDPYVMIFDKPNAPETTKKLQRWCNNKWVFNKCKSFDDYKRK